MKSLSQLSENLHSPDLANLGSVLQILNIEGTKDISSKDISVYEKVVNRAGTRFTKRRTITVDTFVEDLLLSRYEKFEIRIILVTILIPETSAAPLDLNLGSKQLRFNTLELVK